MVFDGRTDNLHWVWDTGLLEHVNRDPEALAAELESRITPQDRAEWAKGAIEDWVMEGHRLARTAAYEGLGNDSPAVIGPAYQRQADPVIELQLASEGKSQSLVRIVVDNPTTAKAVLDTERLASRLGEANININYAYCGFEPGTNAPLLIFGVADVGRAVTILEQTAAAGAGA